MNVTGLRALAGEGQSVVRTIRHDLSPTAVGPVVVSGVLADQLARGLGADAEPGAVIVGGGSPSPGAEVLIHVIPGEPADADDLFVRTADRLGIPVVIVQIWPQADWTPPFVLSPFVVECRAGEGFPHGEIAHRIVDASEHAPLLASRIPVLQDAVAQRVVRQAVLRSAVLGVAGARVGAGRPLIALEQVRMLSRLRAATTGSAASGQMPVIAGGAALTLASGFAFRGVARAARQVLPAPIANAAIAAAGTWALAKAQQALEARIPSA